MALLVKKLRQLCWRDVLKIVLGFISKTKDRNNACIDGKRPSLAVEIQKNKIISDRQSRRGVKPRSIIEIIGDHAKIASGKV